MGPRQCEVCKKVQSKYKCPSCLVPYCSLSCFKKHKENPCNKSSPAVEDLMYAEKPCNNSSPPAVDSKDPCKKSSPGVEDSSTVVLPKIPYEVDEPSWVLNKDQLLSIVESNDIRDALGDRELRELIHKIDCSKDPETELDKAMEGQSFRDFTDKILSIVSPHE